MKTWERTTKTLTDDPGFVSAVCAAFREHGRPIKIARDLGVCESSVRRILQRHGITERNGYRRPGKEPTPEQVEAARKAWLEHGTKIAVKRATGLATNTVQLLLERLFPGVR
jgi:transposase-like protein